MDETGWVSSIKRDRNISGVIVTGPVDLIRIDRGKDGQPSKKPYTTQLGIIVFTRQPRTEVLPWLHRMEPIRQPLSNGVLIQGPSGSVDNILQRAKLQGHASVCRVPVRRGVSAAHLRNGTEEEIDRLVDAAAADERHALDVMNCEALELKSNEELVLFCFSDRSPPQQSLTCRVRSALSAMDVDPRRMMHCTWWAVEAPLRRTDVEMLKRRYADWCGTGLRMKVRGEWVSKPVQRSYIEIHHMPPCSPAEAIQLLKKVNITATSVTRATRRIWNGPRKVSGTWNIEAHGVPQSEIDALRGRMYLRLEQGSLVQVVMVEKPREANSLLSRPIQPWGGRRTFE